jgi:hypothetical protein
MFVCQFFSRQIVTFFYCVQIMKIQRMLSKFCLLSEAIVPRHSAEWHFAIIRLVEHIQQNDRQASDIMFNVVLRVLMFSNTDVP